QRHACAEPQHDARFEAFPPEINRQQAEAEEGEAVPIRRSALVDRQEEVKGEHRQSKPHPEQDLELLIHAPPACDHPPRDCEKQKWRIGKKMRAEKRKNFEWMDSKPLFDASARSQMCQRDPGVLRVPHNRRDGAKSEHSEQET